jgi:Secretion system C-terminal sorting domain
MKKIILSLFFIVPILFTNAQWNGTTQFGNPVSTASNTTAKVGNISTTDGTGGMFIAWVDSRTSSNQSIYVQRILANGSKAFASEILVTNAITGVAGSGNKSNLTLEADGSGGVVLVWLDTRNFTLVPVNNNNDIYGQRINASGTALWTAGGVRMTVSDNLVYQKITPKVSVVNSTEAIVTFGDSRLGNSDLFAQKITLSNGNTGWAADVSVHGNQAGTSTNVSQVADGSNGLYLTWQDARPGSAVADIYSQRIDNSGAMLWGTTGTAVCTQAALQSNPSITLDGTNGAAITWTDNRTGTGDGDIYAQKFNTNGLEQWTNNGIAVCIQAATNQSNSFIIAGGSGFVIIWSDQRAGVGQRNIYANSIDASGNTTWTTAAIGGIPVCAATGNQPTSSVTTGIQIVSDGSNGAVIVWDDARTPTNIDIYAQRLNNTGTAQWATDGVLISNATGTQQGPVVVSDATFNNLIAWRDARGGTANGELYVSKLKPDGVLPINILNISATFINDLPNITWKTSTEINTDKYILQRSDDGINFYDVKSFVAKGQDNSLYNHIDSKVVSLNVFYRVKAIDKNGEINYSSLIKLNNYKKDFFINVYPNPTINYFNVEINNIKKGKYNFRIIDSKGAIIKEQIITIEATFNTIPFKIANLTKGNYSLQIVGLNFNSTKPISIL